jgi:import inner membrane translocase subunit TIM10
MSSFFSSQPAGPSALSVAKMEADLLSDMFGKMGHTCFKKCVTRYTDGEMSVGEMTCVDRCVGKYLMAQERVGNNLQQFEEQMKAQAAVQAGAAGNFGPKLT